MIATIIFMISEEMTQRDYVRYGINKLSGAINLKIIVCKASHSHNDSKHFAYESKWTEGVEILKFKTIKDLFTEISQYKNNVLIVDILEDNLNARKIRLKTKYLNIPRIIFNLGVLPQPGMEKLPRFKRTIYYLISKPVVFGRKLIKRVINEILPSPSADIVLCGGFECLSSPRVKAVPVKVPAHAFDYDSYLLCSKHRVQDNKSYAVFLDEDMVYHSDYSTFLADPPVTEEKYYQSLFNFFIEFERETGLEIIFAVHPRSNHKIYQNYLGLRRYVSDDTPDLVRNAKIVLNHCSTALNYAVLWKKPLVFLTSNELELSYIAAHIKLTSTLLKSKLINIDSFNVDICKLDNLTVDEKAYAKYRESYIKMIGSPDKLNCEILLDYANAYIEN